MALVMNEEQKAPSDDEMITPEDLARQLAVSKQTVYNWLDSKALFGYHLGRLWRIPKKAVDEFLIRRGNGSVKQEEQADETIAPRAARSQKEDS